MNRRELLKTALLTPVTVAVALPKSRFNLEIPTEIPPTNPPDDVVFSRSYRLDYNCDQLYATKTIRGRLYENCHLIECKTPPELLETIKECMRKSFERVV